MLNASIFATFLVHIITILAKQASEILPLTGVFLIYSLPEVAGFLTAAMAGGVLSKAVVKEKWKSQRTKNVFKDAFVLLLISFGLIIIAGFLEVYVGKVLFHRIL